MKDWLLKLWFFCDFCLFVAVTSLWIVAPEYSILNICLTLFFFILTFILFLPRQVDFKTWLQSKVFRNILTEVINVFLILSLLGLGNYLIKKNDVKKDFTQSKVNSLSGQTLKILQSLKSEVKATLYARRIEWGGALELVKLYRENSKFINLDAVDIDTHPQQAKALGISKGPVLVLEYEGRKVQGLFQDELTLTNLFLKVLRDKPFKFAVISGHGELSCEDGSPEGIQYFCQLLKDQNYLVETIDLAKIEKIDSSYNLVMVLGPNDAFLMQEVDKIKKYIAIGGNLLLALAPQFEQDNYKNLRSFIQESGLVINNDLVLDRLSTIDGGEASIPIINQLNPDHNITKEFKTRLVVPLSSSISVTAPERGTSKTTLLTYTSDFPGSWAERDFTELKNGKAEYTEEKDQKGPVSVVGVTEWTSNADVVNRIAAFGSSSFIVNAYQGQTGNFNFILNTISWLVGDEGLITLNRPQLSNSPIILSESHLKFVFYFAIIVVPLSLIFISLLMYRRKKRQ